MATNQDFDDLIDRIEAATETLEEDVLTISNGTGDIAQAVIDAEAAAQAADQSYSDAQSLVTQLENAVIIEEAPKNGQQYAREDGAWTVVTGGGGGSGTVQSVNGETPDGSGDVTITASDITGFATVATSGSYDDLSDTPALATVATSGDYDDLSNTPTLATVATTGDYDDLDNTPTIPSFGTVALEDVVTSNGDTTSTSIPTVSWVTSKNYGNVQVGSNAPVQGGLAVWQFAGNRLLQQYTASSGDEYVRVNATGIVSSRTPAQVKSDLSLGTAADATVVTGTGDTTGSSLTTVDWVNANASGGGGGGGGGFRYVTSQAAAASTVAAYISGTGSKTEGEIHTYLTAQGIENGGFFPFVNLALAGDLPQGGRANITLSIQDDGSGGITAIEVMLQYLSGALKGSFYRARYTGTYVSWDVLEP